MKWNKAEVIATSVVCTATVGFVVLGTMIWTDQPATPAPDTAPVSDTYSVSPDVTSPILSDRGNYTVEVKPPAPVNASTQSAAPESEPFTLPACEQEDSDNCLWDATVQGNGQGMSFIAWQGKYYYLEGSGLNTRIEGDPFALWPKAPVKEYDPGVLMCGTGAAPAEDTDPNGNHWAYCEPALVQ